jgi:ABC-type lipoprotein release transport system permease subunit
MCILVVTTSFTNGLTDIIFNKLMVYMTGHISISPMESTSRLVRVIRDEPRIINLIKENVDGVKQIDEEVMAFGRAINKNANKTTLLFIAGLDEKSEDSGSSDFTMESGNFEDIYKKTLFPGIVIFANTAKELNVKLNDVIQVKFATIYGQPQAPSFQIVGIIHSENMFMDMTGLADIKVIREFVNLKPNESQGLNVIVNYPGDAKKIAQEADKLYAALAPQIAGINATLSSRGAKAQADVFAIRVKSDTDAKALAKQNLEFIAGSVDELAKDKYNVVLSEKLAAALGVGVGQPVNFTYSPKYQGDDVNKDLKVVGVFKSPAGFKDATAFAHDGLFYENYYWNLPKTPASLSADTPLGKALLGEWELMPRSKDTESNQKKVQELLRTRWDGTKLNVGTMYELASAVIDLQRGLNMISVIAVMILFVVILIGVMNTMRMTIRERTREIGTNRAIGMQRGDVRAVFVYEILYLAIFSCLVGLLLGFGLILLISSITVDLSTSAFSMFLVKSHFYFVPTVDAIVSCFLTIIFIAFIIAFFTARRAAKMRAADALRHYE